jgi:hypothetical protein
MPDSYAAAFGDESAMGVIAVALYPEVRHCKPPIPLAKTTPAHPRSYEGKAAGSADRVDASPTAPAASGAQMKDRADKAEKAMESAGTGYGRDEYSPSQIVAFEPEKRPLETIYFKYEWRATLCKLGVANCTPSLRHPPNRLWDHEGYAPPPGNRS